ncbi:Disintegrin and metalloproteinase domain-containing protein B [Termitomyces sp. J132]|nr:Disintegrin and metalloproteinase domain-containing protein B [Termitomyces sp. J132]
MNVYFFFFSLVVLILLSWPLESVHAHGGPARTLKRFVHPSTLSIEIIPRKAQQFSSSVPFSKRSPPPSNTLRHDDTFRLTITAFDEIYYLHLRPNDHLVHPAARINYYDTTPDGRSYISRSEPLLRQSVKAYWGEVIDASHTDARMREDAAGVLPISHPSELGWVRIVVHHQGDMERGISPEYEGAFSANGVVHHIMTKDNYLRKKSDLDPDVSQALDDRDSSLVIWRESDVMTVEEERVAKRDASYFASAHHSSCGHDRLEFNTNPQQNPILLPGPPVSDSWFATLGGHFRNGTIRARDDVSIGSSTGGMSTNFIDNIGSSDGCPKTQKVLFMGVAADCTYVTKHGSQDNATKQILTNWNTASSLYKSTFNVSLGIVELVVQNSSCPSTADSSVPWNVPCSSAELDSRLSLFSQWRGNKGNDGSGLWHLMSGCPTGSEVGIAWLATLCQQDATGSSESFVSGTAVSTAGRTEWQVVAHEIGHNFGAIHDCGDNCISSSPCCPLTATGDCNANSQFIMSPVAQSGENMFSKCSLGNICSVMKGVAGGHTNTTCLSDPDPSRQTISLQMCGNGIVEEIPLPVLQMSLPLTVRVVEVVILNVQVGSVLRLLCSVKQSVSCQDPNQANQCVILTSLLIDGSPCGYGGMCRAGTCQTGSFFDTAKAWYTQNLQIAIPVTIVAGLVVLFILWAIARSIARCCGHRRTIPSSEPAFTRAQHQRIQSWDRPAAFLSSGTIQSARFVTLKLGSIIGTPVLACPNVFYSRVPSQRRQEDWVDETTYNGHR